VEDQCGVGQYSHKKTGEDDHYIADALVICAVGVLQRKLSARGEDEEAHKHPSGTNHEASASSKLLDEVKTRECCTNIDSTCD
jgi:hypothetical protein